MFDDAPETRIIVKPHYNRQLIPSERDKKFFDETYSMNEKTRDKFRENLRLRVYRSCAANERRRKMAVAMKRIKDTDIVVRKCALEEDCEKLSSSQTAVPHAIPIISDDPNDQDRKRWPAIKPAWPTQTGENRK
ncbi:hypothetical protein QTP88_005451 [Uroleucon formosanum]